MVLLESNMTLTVNIGKASLKTKHGRQIELHYNVDIPPFLLSSVFTTPLFQPLMVLNRLSSVINQPSVLSASAVKNGFFVHKISS